MKRFRNGQGGFTLMELMVVIVIVAILAAVAVPLYINYVNDARITEAKGAIGAIVTAEQTHFQQFGAYAADAWDGTAGATHSLNCDLSQATTNWHFTVATTGDQNNPGFTATAKGQGTAYSTITDVVYTYTHNGGGAFDR
jgi:prepilin-type N-terminal cleavage/methylation domain-containing protein